MADYYGAESGPELEGNEEGDRDEAGKRRDRALGRIMRSGQWWRCHETGDDPSPIVDAVVSSMWRRQADRAEHFRRLARAYGCEMAVFGSNIVGDENQLTRAPTNVLANIIGSLQSDIFKNGLIPMPVTDRGDWQQQRRAADLGDFLEGVFQETNVDVLSLLFGLHALLFGTAVVGGERTLEGRIDFSVIPRWEIGVDFLEARYGKPRQMAHRYCIDRGVLFEMYVAHECEGAFGSAAEREEAIEGASLLREPWYDEAVMSEADMVTVTDIVHLPSGPGAKDGRRCIKVHGGPRGTLVDAPYDCPRFPWRIFTLEPPIGGVDGIGVAERILPNHDFLAFLDSRFREAVAQVGVPRVYIDKAAGVSKEHITDEISVLTGNGPNPPIVLNWESVTPDQFNIRELIKREMYEISGSNNLQSNGQLPAGLREASGAALAQYEDQYSARHAVKFRMRESFVVHGLADLAIDLAEEEGDYEVRLLGDKGMKKLRWKDVRMDRADFVLKVYSGSELSRLPAARFNQLMQLLEAGVVNIFQFRQQWRVLDVRGAMELGGSLYDIILERLDAIAFRGEYYPPETLYDLPLAIQTARKFYCHLETQPGFPEERLMMIRQFIQEAELADRKAKAAAAPPPPPMLGPPGGGVPGAPPMIPAGVPGLPPGGPGPGDVPPGLPMPAPPMAA